MICCSLAPLSKEKAIYDMLRVRSKADLIEIRLDYISDLTEGDIKEIISKKTQPIIMTCRKADEGGKFSGNEKDRIEILKKCLQYGADYIDIELSAGDKIISELLNQKKIQKSSAKIIVSYHNFKSLPDNIEYILNKIKNTGCDILKIACMANDIKDNLVIFNILEKAHKEKLGIIALCMGERGEISRILNISRGSYLTYGFLDKEKSTADGQISCEFLKRVYRADKIKKDWKIYGVIGNPVSESRGFLIHNLAFKAHNLDAVYLNFLVDNIKDFFEKFSGFFSGLSVTMPYKEKVLEYLDEIDDLAGKIKAVNTISAKNKKLIGFNTDAYGAVKAIKEKSEIMRKNVLMIGAGGVARAIGFGIIKEGGNLILSNRTEKKGKMLSAELNCIFKKQEELNLGDVDILINATSVGMMPNINESLIERRHLKNMVVFETVYNPLVTKLLKDAEKNKCKTVSGIKMFIYQAEQQFELWTGIKPDYDVMETIVLEYTG